MKHFRILLKSPVIRRGSVWLLAQYIRFVFLTSRKRYDIHPDSVPYLHGKENAIFAFWHGRMMMMPCVYPRHRPMHVLISLHRDGVLISDVMQAFNLSTIHGSSSRNGRSALMTMLRLLKNGENVAITPDGPRGPFQIAAAGVASAAKLSGKPIIPVAFSATRHKRARSWDRFMFALPFARINFCVGAPIMIEKSMPDEESRIMVEHTMNQLTDIADAAIL